MDVPTLESQSLAVLLSNINDDNLSKTISLLSYKDLIRLDLLIQQTKIVCEKEVYVLLWNSCPSAEYYNLDPLHEKFLTQYDYMSRKWCTDPVFILSAALLTKCDKYRIVKKVNDGTWKVRIDDPYYNSWGDPPISDEIEKWNYSSHNIVKVLKRPENLYKQITEFATENGVKLNMDNVKDFPTSGNYRVLD